MTPTTWKRSRLLISAVILVMASAVFWLIRGRSVTRTQTGIRPEGQRFHIVLVLPQDSGSDSGDSIEAVLDKLKGQWNLWTEVHTFETIAEQKRMLRLLPDTDVDGVVLWPISEDDEDYEGELEALREKGVPVVVIERNVAPTARDSYIGSGYSSDSVVLTQCLLGRIPNDRFLVGNRFGSGSGQVVEFLIFGKTEKKGECTIEPHNVKLRRMAEDPPDGYSAESYLCLSGEEARSLNVRSELAELIEDVRPCLIFSLDNTLTPLVLSADHEEEKKGRGHCYILGYGDRETEKHAMLDGTLDGLVVSRPETSVYIGVRYLLDLRRGMWVPEQMDSGITFIEQEDAARPEAVTQKDDAGQGGSF